GNAGRSTAPVPQSKPVARASRLVAQIAPLVASGLGPRILAAGPAPVRLYTHYGRLCGRRPSESSRAIRFRAWELIAPTGPLARRTPHEAANAKRARQQRPRRTGQPAPAECRLLPPYGSKCAAVPRGRARSPDGSRGQNVHRAVTGWVRICVAADQNWGGGSPDGQQQHGGVAVGQGPRPPPRAAGGGGPAPGRAGRGR